jgi:hypothetical protein
MELLFVDINKVVVNLVLIGKGRVELQDFVFDVMTEFYSRVLLNAVLKVCAG